MIRRQVGGEWFLITQNDHAQLSGQLAKQWGNDRFALPEPLDSTIAAAALHDAGWPIHDDEGPTLNPRGQPLDVFESTRPIALMVWRASAERAQAIDPYAGLLVSMHSLSLSVFATSQSPMKHEKFDTRAATEQFEINKFQHREIERQENLRKQLGMRTDIPLEYGLAERNIDAREDQLRFNFRMLQAMDQISLACCCTQPPSETTTDVHMRAGGKSTKLKLRRRGAVDVTVDPWPFRVNAIPLEVPYRRLLARSFASEEEFRSTYAATPNENLSLVVKRE